MQDLFRRLVGGRQAGPANTPAPAAQNGARAQAIPGAPFTRDELPALLGERPGLAEFVAGRSESVASEFGTLPLVEAGLWLTFLGDAPRAAAAFRAAADAELPRAQLGSPAGLAEARREALPVEAGVKAGAHLSLAGDPAGAARTWRETAEQYEPLVLSDAADEEADEWARRTWQTWKTRLEEIDRLGEGAARAREDEPLDPAKLGRMSVFLAYARLRTGDPERARQLLAREAALRSAAPDARAKRHYADMMFMAGTLAEILRGAAALGTDGMTKSIEKGLQAYLKLRHPEAQAFVLDLQRAFPERIPALLPPADLTEALTGRARQRLEEARR